MVKSSPGVHPKPRVGPILDSTDCLALQCTVDPPLVCITGPSVAPPSSVVKCLWEVFVRGFGVLFLSCACVSVSGVLFSVGVCVCELLMFYTICMCINT